LCFYAHFIEKNNNEVKNTTPIQTLIAAFAMTALNKRLDINALKPNFIIIAVGACCLAASN